MQKSTTPNSTQRLLLSGMVAIIAVFIAYGLHAVVAATAVPFVEPTCDPTKDPNCNTYPPILSGSPDAQTLKSDLTISGGKNLITTGPIQIQDGSSLLTTDSHGASVAISGQPVNVQSNNNYAVKAISTSPGKSALYGSGFNGAHGVFGQSDSGYGIYGSAPTAGFFDGDVKITGKLTVADKSISGGSTQATNSYSNVAQYAALPAGTGVVTWDLKSDPNVFNNNSYQLVSFFAMTRPYNSFSTAWVTVPQADISYAECQGAAFKGLLNIKNNTGGAADYRVFVSYTNTPINCGDSTPPSPGAISGVQANFWYSGTVTLSVPGASDANGISYVEYYRTSVTNGVSGAAVRLATVCSGTAGGTNPCDVSNVAAPFNYSWNTAAGAPNNTPNTDNTVSPLSPTYTIYAIVYDGGGNHSTTASIAGVNITNGASLNPCNSSTASTLCSTGQTCCQSTKLCIGGHTVTTTPPSCTATASACGQCAIIVIPPAN